jgi:hypothetical protein
VQQRLSKAALDELAVIGEPSAPVPRGCRAGAGPACPAPRLVINGTPDIHPLAGDPHHHLVQMPAIAWPRAPPAQPPGDHRPEFQHPAPHRS